MFTAPKLREKLVQTVEEGGYKIIVNLENVSFMDSTGLGTLVGGLKRVKEHEGTLALVCSSRPVLRVLSITGLNNVFPIYNSVDEAVASAG
jgi:anti-sigma B factor antagonist